MHSVAINNHSITVSAVKGTILEAALDAGLPFPHACRAGACGTCKSRLLAGRVEMGDCAPEALDEADQAAGYILACRAKPSTDITIEWLAKTDDGLPMIRKAKAGVLSVEAATHDISRLRLELTGQPLRFFAGQYAELSFNGRPARPYSMANRPDDPILEFHVRHLPNGAASSYVAAQLRRGETVRVRGPMGSAHWSDTRTPIVAIAGGSGLAPIRSIALTALNRCHPQPFYLYFGVRDERDLYAEQEFLAMSECHPQFHFVPVLSASGESSNRRTGWVHEAVAEDFPNLADYTIHLAGPPVMVEAATHMALQHGADRARIFADAFASAADQDPARGLFGLVGRWFGTRTH